jgi:hypothetical protein
MREIDIRMAVRQMLHRQFRNEPHTLLVEEFGLCQGTVRVDVAAINGRLHGYEIKSEQDTLVRLPRQQAAYSKVLDMVHVVASSGHLGKLDNVIPSWWGILLAEPNRRHSVRLTEIRRGEPNPSPDRGAMAQLLWRDEALAVLEARGLDLGLRGKPRRFLWERLATELSTDDLGVVVRDALMNRSTWRADSQRT